MLSLIFRLFILLEAGEGIFMKRKPVFAKQFKELNFGKHQNMNCEVFQTKIFPLRITETIYFEINENYSFAFSLSFLGGFFMTGKISEQVFCCILFFTHSKNSV